MTDPIMYLLNDHRFYMVESPEDHVRAWTWCMTNFVTAVSYFSIPFEIRYWRQAAASPAFGPIAMMFKAFIFLCGLSHAAMIAIMPIGPWWAIYSIYAPMALVSVATALALRSERGLIVKLLGSVNVLMRSD